MKDWVCPRARYLGYEYDGIGLVKGTSLELYTGTTIHDSLAMIGTLQKDGLPIDIDLIARTAYTQMYDNLFTAMKGDPDQQEYSCEQATLVEGLIRGFYKHVWPRLLAEYPIILLVEEELEYKYDDLLFMSKPDLVMATANGEAVYVEFKSTKSKREDWITSWDTAVQLHSTVRAIEAQTGIKCEQVIVQGLYKGAESYGKQNSPFCYVYLKKGNPPFTVDQVEYAYKYGFKRSATWEMPGGVKSWIDGMPENILADQFPRTAPILVDDDLVDAWFRQRSVREHEIATASAILLEGTDGTVEDELDRQKLLDRVFPQKWDACSPAYGRACEYRRICFGDVQDPLSSGYSYREPHHVLEMERFNNMKEQQDV